MLSMSGERDEAELAIAAVERLGNLDGSGPLPDGFSSAEASLTMLRAVFPWGDVGAQLENARRVVELEGIGSPWRPSACWAVGAGQYFRGEFGEADPWFAESVALAPASGQWMAGASSLAYRSLIAGEQGRLEDQRMLAEQAVEFAREHSIGGSDWRGVAGSRSIVHPAPKARRGAAADRARGRGLAVVGPAHRTGGGAAATCCGASHSRRPRAVRHRDRRGEIPPRVVPDPGILASWLKLSSDSR